MSLSATIKRGDHFRPALSVTNGGAGITGWVIASQIRDKDDNLVAELEVFDRNDIAGTYSLRPTSAYPETGWPVGSLQWDIEYVDSNGLRVSTQTITLRCEKDVTRP